MPCNQRSHGCGTRGFDIERGQTDRLAVALAGRGVQPVPDGHRGYLAALRFRPVRGKAQGLLRRRSGTNHITDTAANRA